MASFVKIVTIDSAHRERGTPSRFVLAVKPPLPTIKRVRLLSVAIPLTHYTVTTNNNRIYFSNGTDNFFAAVPPGVYNIGNLPAAINAAFLLSTKILDLSTAAFVVVTSVDQIQMAITITPAVPLALRFGSFTVGSMADYLGYDPVDTGLSIVLTATGSYNLSVPPQLYIDVRELPITVRTAGQATSAVGFTPQTVFGTFPLTLTSDSGGVSFHFAQTNYLAEALTSIAYLTRLNIALVDPRTGNDFVVRGDWVMSWHITYEGEAL